MAMKPTNYNKTGCGSITSSNCVIWEGPDIPCINLCKGDTVSDVVAKLGTELCNILETLNVDTYDFSCLNIQQCEPESFQELFQLLIERICELENVDTTGAPVVDGCPDCVVDLATCFYFQNEIGDTIRTLQLVDYVRAIGNRICEILQDIININATLNDHEGRITQNEQSIESLAEGFRQTSSRQSVTPSYVLVPGEPTPIDEVVTAVEQQFGELRTATGTPNEIYQNVAKMMTGVNDLTKLAGDGDYGSIEGWTDVVRNIAESHGNILLMLEDMRAAILNLKANLPSACDDVQIYLTAALDGPNTLNLFFTGTLPTGYTECDALGTIVTITDSAGGQLIDRVPIIANLNNATGYAINLLGTPINPLDDLTITTNPCFTDPVLGTKCQSCVEYFLNNTLACPSVILTPTETTIGYQFNHIVSDPASYQLDLYDSSGTVLIASITEPVSGAATVTGEFTGLSNGTEYRLRVTVTVNSTTTECPWQTVSTLPASCTPPGGVSAVINL